MSAISRKKVFTPARAILRKGRKAKLDSREKSIEIARLARNKKAERVTIIDIAELSSVSDYIVVCSGASERQVQAIATEVEEELKKNNKERPMGVEGAENGRWILMDYVDVVVHIFLEEVRGFYDLEGLWADAVVLEPLEPKGDDDKGRKHGAEKNRTRAGSL